MIGAYLQNRYRLEAELGQGGMGTVYRAYDTLLDRLVALKVLNTTGLGTEGRARLLREARAAAWLNHPNITAIYDAGEADGASFIVMELLTGHTLREHQSQSLSETIEISTQMCLALEHAHANGIIHRDLKPENVMLVSGSHPVPLTQPIGGGAGEGVRVKLMDFGLAFHSGATRITQESMLVGTITYLAPELIEGMPATAASDLYALGVILYELAAQRPPFVGDTLMMVLSQHLYAPVVPPSAYSPSIPPALDQLIVSLLSKHPEDRPASASEVRHLLETLEQPATIALSNHHTVELSLLDRIVRGRLIARERELAEAQHIWQRAANGEGQVLLISGEPGIGKTRLVRELMAQSRFTGAQVLLGECYAEGGVPYAPLAQMIQAALPSPASGGGLRGGLSQTLIADLLTIAPALRANYPDVPPNPPLEPQIEQQRIFEHFLAFLARLSDRAPVLLIVDDAHWADSATLALLRYVARRSRQLRLLMILTYREIELDEARPFNTVLLDLNRERLTTRLKLTRFDRDQTRTLLATLLQQEITADLLEGVYRETEGNPFFIEEVCKELVEAGSLCCTNGHWQLAELDQIEIPQNVRLTIQARVNKLPDQTQDTLRLAAVLGREFDFDTLHAMSDLDEDSLIDALDIAQRAQLIDEALRGKGSGTGSVAFAFAHALIPTTLHESLSGLRRQRLHRRAAQAIERVAQRADRVEDCAAQLGRHYAQAGEGERAIEYLLQAGDQARRVYAYEAAIEHYQQALAFLKEQGSIGLARAARTAMNLGTLQHTLFNFDRSRAAFQEAFELWQRVKEAQAQQTLPPAPHALRRYWPARMGALDPGWRSSTETARLIEQLFSGLVELNADFDIVPLLARSWELSEDGREYVFHLRRDAAWSDGTPLTAHDFEFAWKRVLDPATGATESADYLFDIRGARAFHHDRRAAHEVGVRALDDFTLRVELEEPVGHFLHLLAYHIAAAVPQHAIAAHGESWTNPQHIVTHGPFRLESWTPDQTIVLARDPNYRGQFGGNLTRIELTLGVNVAKDVLLDGYAANQSDQVIFGATLLERLRQRSPAEYHRLPAALTTYLAFDATRPPFDDVRVRRALAHAIDRHELTQGLLQGASSPALGGLTPPGLPGHSDQIGLPYDPARAQQLLVEAGYPGGRGFPEIAATVADAGEATRVTNEYLTTQWRDQLGLHVTWNTLDVLAFQEAMSKTTPHLYRETWAADYPDPDDFLRLALHQPHSRWHNERFELLLDSARRMTDAVERLKFYQAADRLLLDEAGVIPLTYGYYHCWLKPWITRFPASPLKTTYWKDAIIESH
jgi:ABC-type oligopeptide transport system substrate-binding subunit/type II secretory pathway predicted ATPase ExeA